jgi:hypothetical protein
MSLYCAELGVLISGDMLLPRISTNISVMASTPEADPLGLFLASIDGFRSLPADTLVLPSHGRPFRGLHARIDQLHAHHAERCAVLLDACRGTPKNRRRTDRRAVQPRNPRSAPDHVCHGRIHRPPELPGTRREVAAHRRRTALSVTSANPRSQHVRARKERFARSQGNRQDLRRGRRSAPPT